MARNFMNTGTWTGWDGRNLIAYNNGANLEANLRHIIPQLDARYGGFVLALLVFRRGPGAFLLLSLVCCRSWCLPCFSSANFPGSACCNCLLRFAGVLGALSAFGAYLPLLCVGHLFALLVFVFYRQAVQRQRVVDFVGWVMVVAAFSHQLPKCRCVSAGAGCDAFCFSLA
jgi:hypothetical protein